MHETYSPTIKRLCCKYILFQPLRNISQYTCMYLYSVATYTFTRLATICIVHTEHHHHIHAVHRFCSCDSCDQRRLFRALVRDSVSDRLLRERTTSPEASGGSPPGLNYGQRIQ